MAVLVLGGLEEAHRGQVVVGDRLVEVAQVVLVVRLAVVADLGEVLRGGVVRVGRGLVVLERVMVRAVVLDLSAADVGVGVAAALGVGPGHPGVGGARGEAALEPAPGDVLLVEQVADVLAGHLTQRGAAGVVVVGAVVVGRVRVGVDGADALGVRRVHRVRVRGGGPGRVGGAARAGDRDHAVGLARDQVQRAGGGRPVGGVEGVVGQRVLLGVVPHAGDGVAVVVVHGQARRAVQAAGAGVLGRVLHEQVVLAAVERQLLRRVAVVLVAGQQVRGGQPGRRVEVRVLRQQTRRGLGVDLLRGVLRGRERRAVGVRRVRVGAEVVVERHVLVVDDHQVLDRCRRGRVPGGLGAVVVAAVPRPRGGRPRSGDQRRRTQQCGCTLSVPRPACQNRHADPSANSKTRTSHGPPGPHLSGHPAGSQPRPKVPPMKGT